MKNFAKIAQMNASHHNTHPTRHYLIMMAYGTVAAVATYTEERHRSPVVPKTLRPLTRVLVFL